MVSIGSSKQKKGFIAPLSAVAVITAVLIFLHPSQPQIAPLGVSDGAEVQGFGRFHDSVVTHGRKSFASDQYGISFTYPGNYFAFDGTSIGSDRTALYGIALLPDSPEFRRAITGDHNEPGMIPRISIVIYKQNGSSASLEEIARKWITNANGEQAPIPSFNTITVGGLPALRYTDASGLYARDTVLVRNGDWVVQFTADDPTYFKADLDSILSSLTFKSIADTASSFSVSAGDKLGAMTVVSVAPFNTGQYSTDPKMTQLGPQNAKIILKGPIEITGMYSTEQPDMGGSTGPCMSVSDAASLARLPVLPGNGVRPDIPSYSFCFRNQKAAEQQLGKESRTVTVAIDNFELNAYPAEVMSWADLVDVQ